MFLLTLLLCPDLYYRFGFLLIFLLGVKDITVLCPYRKSDQPYLTVALDKQRAKQTLGQHKQPENLAWVQDGQGGRWSDRQSDNTT